MDERLKRPEAILARSLRRAGGLGAGAPRKKGGRAGFLLFEVARVEPEETGAVLVAKHLPEPLVLDRLQGIVRRLLH